MLCSANAVFVDFENFPEDAENLIDEALEAVLVAAAGAVFARVYRRFGSINAVEVDELKAVCVRKRLLNF